jgi:glycosyltransferase involved in cell wall biosynthesis
MVPRWTSKGWTVTVVTQTAPAVQQLPQGIDVRVFDRRGWYDRFPLAQVRRLFELRRIVRAFRPDVVHSYFFWSIMYGRILKLLGEVPILVESREDMGFSWGRSTYRLLRLTRRVPDRIICVAESVREVVLAREGADPARTTAIRNGVEASVAPTVTREQARREFGLDDRHVVIGMVANLPRPVKGGRRLLDAVAPIVAAVPDARFLLVGMGTDHASLGEELRARGISEHVIAAGYRADVQTCYAAMDISVLTSSTEGLSITLLESMKAGLPVVATRVGGNPEVVIEGATGFLVDLDDVSAFVERVVVLVRDPDRRRTMGIAGRQRVTTHFAMEAVAQRYLDVYADVLDDGRPTLPRTAESFGRLERNA